MKNAQADTLRIVEEMAHDALRASGGAETGVLPQVRSVVRQVLRKGPQLADPAQMASRALLVLTRAVSSSTAKLQQEIDRLREQLEARLGVDNQKTGFDEEDYLAFENEFRGTPESVSRRLEVYRPFLEPLAASQSGGAVLEIGCGRGEMAVLLSSLGFRYRGCDVNARMVDRTRAEGFEVETCDGLEYLDRAPDRSLSAIASLHVIEHLPTHRLVQLFRSAKEKLTPGGLLILETPNGSNLTSALNFPLDPTHLRMVHPLMLRFLAERHGLEVLRLEDEEPLEPLEPVSSNMPEADVLNRNFRRINELLFGGQDLVFVARLRKAE